MANVYDLMQTITVTASFTDDDGPADPTTVTLMVQSPSGTETTYTYALGEITKDAVGSYSKNVEGDEPGRWYYRWEGVTNDVTAVVEDVFYVLVSEFY